MDINIEDGVKGLNEKYKLSENPSKQEIIGKIKLFLNGNKSFKPLYTLKIGVTANAARIVNCTPLSNDFMAKAKGNVSIFDFFAGDKKDGERTIFKIYSQRVSEINVNMSLATLKKVYEAYVQNVGNYANTFIRLRNLANAVNEHGKVYFPKMMNDRIIINVIESMSLNTLNDKLSYSLVRFDIYRKSLSKVNKSHFKNSEHSIAAHIYKINQLLNLDAMSKNDLCRFLDETMENERKKILNDFKSLKNNIFTSKQN